MFIIVVVLAFLPVKLLTILPEWCEWEEMYKKFIVYSQKCATKFLYIFDA